MTRTRGLRIGPCWTENENRVTKRQIDVDDDKLEAVRAFLGTRTLKATVDEAFDEILAVDQRRRALLAQPGVDLSDPGARQAAWG